MLAYAGAHHNGHTLSDADLAEIATNTTAIGEAPLTVGHVRGTGHPRYGRFTNSMTAATTNPLTGAATTCLIADGEALPVIRDQINAGFWNQRSVGVSTGPNGKYLHHVAVLGVSPPAVKGMKDLAFSADELAFELTISDPTDFYDGSPLTRVLSNQIDRVASTDAYADRAAVLAAMAAEAEIEVAAIELVLDGDVPRPRTEWRRAFARALGISKQTLIDTSDFF